MFHFCPLVFSVYTISKENKSSDGEGNDCPTESVVEVNAFRTFLTKIYQSSIQRSSGQANQEEKPSRN